MQIREIYEDGVGVRFWRKWGVTDEGMVFWGVMKTFSIDGAVVV